MRKRDEKMSISLEEAEELIKSKLHPLSTVRLPLHKSLGLITAEDLTAEIDQPPFPRSPYDGYALRATDSVGASRERPVTLKVIGKSYAGKPSGITVGSGETVRIMTGGEIPSGADCVIAQEHTDEGNSQVRIYAKLHPFENYCSQGEDFLCGCSLIKCGTPVTAAVVGVAAGTGRTELNVFPKPRAALLSTGDELQTPGNPLGKGQIYDSNSALLDARLRELRIPVTETRHINDELSELKNAFEAAVQNSDIVISTGGVSAGERDLVPSALESLGAEMVFHGVAIKPGMPAALAILHGKPVIALSGNPFASAVSFELLVRPALAVLASDSRLCGRKDEAVLAESFSRKRSVRLFRRAILTDGKLIVPGEQGNGQLKTMIGCNCIAELPEGTSPLASGTVVKIYMLDGEIYGS